MRNKRKEEETTLQCKTQTALTVGFTALVVAAAVFFKLATQEIQTDSNIAQKKIQHSAKT